ncbi:flagellar biosynthesis protein FlhG [Mariprofundus ferrinatatus]|uniref:Flagellar biosynthesis protein FlhG n=1 Tax=Mariprofundus ferrinatatus TaxID=1921087 RepID=A0A2K8LF89_9PROT|nr:MinD/ParA family protein [Mariprofundus ferrinatatus]ATX82936.1 flagellar biosynthesis protein FlhG [Mariprofundus ferrinatatus]
MNNSPDGLITQRSPQVIAVSSGKGGVGKTFISVHLAARAAQQGKRVLLIDADLGMANVDIMLGLTAKGSILQVIEGQAEIHDILVKGAERLDVLPGGSGLHELAHLSSSHQHILLSELDNLTRNYDLVLVDTGAGIGENVMFYASSSESVLIVLTPDPTSLTDAYALIKVLSTRHNTTRFMVAVNQADEVAAQVVFRRLLAVSDRYLDVILDYVGNMPECSSVRTAIQSQKLLYACGSQKDINNLNKLADSALSRPRPSSGGSGLQFSWQSTLAEGLHANAMRADESISS